MDDAEGVLEARAREHLRHGPLDRVGHIGACVELRELAHLVLDRGQAQVILQLEDLGERRAVADLVRPIRVGREVHVGYGHDAPGERLDEDVEPVRAGRVDDRVAGDDLRARAALPAELQRERARVHGGLVESDDVGTRGTDHARHLVERLGTAGGGSSQC